MKWVYVIAMAAFVAGSCTLRSADNPLMSTIESVQPVTG